VLPIDPLPGERSRLERRARHLAWGGIAWHFIEFAIAVVAGLAAGSIALIGFGADSLIEALAGLVVVWLFTGNRVGSPSAERRAQQLIAASFFVLAAYIGVESLRMLIGGDHPEASWLGIGLAAFTAPTMPLLARAKRQVGSKLHSSAAVKEASQTQLCAYLSIALLVGLGTNALLGWWWADPISALAIAAVALKEGRESWRGEGCAEGCC
jgi:divalent metal cation (Fe/Co/Zn/Cd) transporter